MRFPNAYKAVKKLFLAEIISIAVALLSLVAAVLSAVAVASPNNGLVISAGTLALVSVIALVVVFVLQLVAMIQGGKDEDNFHTALWVTLIAIAVTVASAILQSIEVTKGMTLLISVFDAFSSVATIVVMVLVLYAISNLANQLHNQELAEKGRRLAFYIVILFAVSTILGFVPGIFVNKEVPQFVTVMMTVFGIVAAVIELLIYINILIYYRRAIKTLKK